MMHVRVKRLSRLKKSEGENAIFYSLLVLQSQGDNLQGIIAQETKDRGH